MHKRKISPNVTVKNDKVASVKKSTQTEAARHKSLIKSMEENAQRLQIENNDLRQRLYHLACGLHQLAFKLQNHQLAGKLSQFKINYSDILYRPLMQNINQIMPQQTAVSSSPRFITVSQSAKQSPKNITAKKTSRPKKNKRVEEIDQDSGQNEWMSWIDWHKV